MKVFIVPSWYPSVAFPYTGIFFKEQAALLATHRPDWCVGVSVWGSHEPDLWVRPWQPLDALLKLSRRPGRFADTQFSPNGATFYQPAYTWTRRLGGNLKGIIAANEANFQRYTAHFGPPDVLHAHVAYPAGWVAQHLSKKYGIPYLITEHMSPFPLPSFQRDFRRTILPPLKGASRVLVVSKALCDCLRSYGIHSTISSNFIDDSLFTPPVNQENELFTFVSVGRLELQKGHTVLLEAVRQLNQQGLRFEVNIIGDGTLGRQLRAAAPANVRFLGAMDQVQIRHHLRQSDVFVLPSLHENQPVAILEAMACGLPVITTDWAGADEMIIGESGAIVAKSDPGALATAMSRYMQYLPERARIRHLFEAKYATAQCISRLEAEYASVAG